MTEISGMEEFYKLLHEVPGPSVDFFRIPAMNGILPSFRDVELTSNLKFTVTPAPSDSELALKGSVKFPFSFKGEDLDAKLEIEIDEKSGEVTDFSVYGYPKASDVFIEFLQRSMALYSKLTDTDFSFYANFLGFLFRDLEFNVPETFKEHIDMVPILDKLVNVSLDDDISLGFDTFKLVSDETGDNLDYISVSYKQDKSLPYFMNKSKGAVTAFKLNSYEWEEVYIETKQHNSMLCITDTRILAVAGSPGKYPVTLFY